MLVLSRRNGEVITIGDQVTITVVDIRGEKVRLGIDAPPELAVHRKEVYETIQREARAAASLSPARAEFLAARAPEPGSSLPAGRTCGDCANWERCRKLISSLTGQETACDFAPSRFREDPDALS